MGSASSMAHQQQQQHNVSPYTATASTSTPGHTVYPNLDITNGYNPSLPFSSSINQQHVPPHQRNSLAAPSSRHSSSNLARTASPIDNVPFTLSAGPGGAGGLGGVDDDTEVADTLARIHQFMSNPNLSEYNFKLENSILRESLLT